MLRLRASISERDAATSGRGRALTLPRWPGLCAVCRGWGRGRICSECLQRYAPAQRRCARCALPLATPAALCGACMIDAPPFDGAVAAFDYAPPWDRLIADFKFHGAIDLAATLADVLAAAIPTAEAVPSVDCLMPVPLAGQRLRERGYNQAWEIARRLARRLALEAMPRTLLRLRETPHQLDLALDERAGNVRGAFAVEPSHRSALAGRRVAVVDDVMTTGHTLAEIARVLKQAGAAQVVVWVVARTPLPRHELAPATTS